MVGTQGNKNTPLEMAFLGDGKRIRAGQTAYEASLWPHEDRNKVTKC